ncbi:MAG: thioredoxin family protein [Verrucomicrobiota bacterium]
MKILNVLLPLLLFGMLITLGYYGYQASQTPLTESLATDDTLPTSFRSAIINADEEDKPVILIFSADRCGACRVLESKTLKSSKVRSMRDQLIWLKVDVDQSKNYDLARRYGVKGIPRTVLLKSNGREVGSLVGFTGPDDFARFLQKAL